MLFWTQDEVLALRAQLAEAYTMDSTKSNELSAKTGELMSARAKLNETESELLVLKDSFASTASELKKASAVVASVPELEAALAALADEKKDSFASISREAEQARAKVGELGIVVRSLQEDKEHALESAQQTHQGRAEVVAQLSAIASSLG